ncbi:MAG: Holliday junction branch migration protein RuvA [Holosporales bacterium]|jgi:Holliday junction DNA helicase RuvA|nr:Holliday junction branch migration protein RuvA [Holosporales bacterium]
MIAKLRGVVDTISEDSVIIDVHDIGFSVLVSSRLRDSLSVGQETVVRILHIFIQESQYLCGFESDEEISIFKALLSVRGVGIKSAMSVLSVLSIGEFAIAVANQDSDILCNANGVGRKTAERILLELKDKTLLNMKDISATNSSNFNDAVLGLINLGYQKSNVLKAMTAVSRRLGTSASVNDLIIECLREIK